MATKTKTKRKQSKLTSGPGELAVKPKKKPVTAAQVDRIAKLRRGGATWPKCAEAVPATKSWKSDKFARALAERGYDRLGRKNGKGDSKARAHGRDLLSATKP